MPDSCRPLAHGAIRSGGRLEWNVVPAGAERAFADGVQQRVSQSQGYLQKVWTNAMGEEGGEYRSLEQVNQLTVPAEAACHKVTRS